MIISTSSIGEIMANSISTKGFCVMLPTRIACTTDALNAAAYRVRQAGLHARCAGRSVTSIARLKNGPVARDSSNAWAVRQRTGILDKNCVSRAYAQQCML